MKKSSYTEDEVRKVFQTLYIEKKKVQELQKKVQDLGAENQRLGGEALSLDDPRLKEGLDRLIAGKTTPLEDELGILRSQKARDADRIKELAALLKKLQKARQDALDELDAEKQGGTAIRSQVQSLQEDLSKTAAELEATKADLANVYHKYNSEIDHSKEEIRGTTEEKSRLAKELANREQKIQELTQELEDVKKDAVLHRELRKKDDAQQQALLKGVSERDKRIEALEQFEYRYKKMQQQKLDVEKHVQSIQEELRAYRESEQKLKALNQQDKTALQSQNEKLRLLGLALKQEREAATVKKEEMEALKAAIVEKQAQVASLETTAAEGEKSQKELQEQVEAYSRQLHQRTATLEEHRKGAELIKQTLVRGVRQAQNLEERYLDVVSEKAGLQSKLETVRRIGAETNTQVQDLKAQLAQAEKGKDNAETRIEDLQGTLESLTSQNRDLRTTISELECSKAELLSRQSQLEDTVSTAGNKAESLKEQVRTLELRCTELSQWERECARLKEEIEAKEEDINSLQQSLREKTMASEKAGESVAAWEEKFSDLEDKYASLREEFNELSRQADEMAELRLDLEQQVQVLQDEKAAFQGGIQEKEALIEQAKEREEKLEEELLDSQKLIEDREGRIAVSQQHLGKKVKEYAVLQEKLEGQNAQLLELKNQISHLNSKVQEFAKQRDILQAQEKRMQELLNESIRSTKAQVGEWEAKYFRMQEKWQAADAEVKDLKKLEVEYKKLHGVLKNLGNFLGTNTLGVSAADVPDLEEVVTPEPVQAPPQKTLEVPMETVDLFGSEQSGRPSRGRGELF